MDVRICIILILVERAHDGDRRAKPQPTAQSLVFLMRHGQAVVALRKLESLGLSSVLHCGGFRIFVMPVEPEPARGKVDLRPWGDATIPFGVETYVEALV